MLFFSIRHIPLSTKQKNLKNHCIQNWVSAFFLLHISGKNFYTKHRIFYATQRRVLRSHLFPSTATFVTFLHREFFSQRRTLHPSRQGNWIEILNYFVFSQIAVTNSTISMRWRLSICMPCVMTWWNAHCGAILCLEHILNLALLDFMVSHKGQLLTKCYDLYVYQHFHTHNIKKLISFKELKLSHKGNEEISNFFFSWQKLWLQKSQFLCLPTFSHTKYYGINQFWS